MKPLHTRESEESRAAVSRAQTSSKSLVVFDAVDASQALAVMSIAFNFNISTPVTPLFVWTSPSNNQKHQVLRVGSSSRLSLIPKVPGDEMNPGPVGPQKQFRVLGSRCVSILNPARLASLGLDFRPTGAVLKPTFSSHTLVFPTSLTTKVTLLALHSHYLCNFQTWTY
ncbi:hypothetical protein HNY73_021472 [Argiope bruennichi]|uniref:Uncharacterized protein n=1 Tax=Argiope bruennichi TaxID=94029 RepID=A0A8T0E1B7_ARGBR|nr:hypothetical protein HNY73_021472 [Argiope bruennichi]